MESWRRQHILQQLLVLPVLWPVVAALFTFSLPSSGNGAPRLMEKAVTSMLSGPLRGQDLLLVVDEHSQRMINVDQVVASAGASLTPIIQASQYSLLYDTRPEHHLKGSLLTALLIFYDDPSDFLFSLEENLVWQPNYFILACLNTELNTTAIIKQPVVQRSLFILLLQLTQQTGQQRLQAYTSKPFVRNNQGNFLVRAPLGYWDKERFSSRESLFPPRFNDFGGKVWEFPVVCYDNPFLYLSNGACTGGNVDALRVIGNKYNFTLEMYHWTTINWGEYVNGTWIGMLGELIYKRKDIMLNSNKLIERSMKDFDWVYPYMEYYFSVTLKIPPPLPLWRNILYPFSPVMWLLILLVTLGVASFLAALLYWMDIIDDPIGLTLKVSMGIVNQPMPDREVVVWWARIYLIFWWVAVDIIAAAYMSNLVSVLTVPAFPKRIQTLEELAESDFIPSMLDYGSFVPPLLRASKNPVLGTLGRKLFMDHVIDLDYPYNFLLDLVMEGTHAVICSSDYIIYTLNLNSLSRSTYFINDRLLSDYLTWHLPKHTPYTLQISDTLMQLVESGILAKIFRGHSGGNIWQVESQTRGSGVLNLGHMQGAFILLGLGLLAGSMVLLAELWVWKGLKTRAN